MPGTTSPTAAIANHYELCSRQSLTKTGLSWNELPREMGCGSGAACWVRLHEWHQRGGWKKLHAVLLAKLRYADKIDGSRAAADSMTLRALRGGDKTGKTPTDRGRKGTKITCSPMGAACPWPRTPRRPTATA